MSFDEETGTSLERAQKELENLANVSAERKDTARGFELVLSSLVLQCRCGEEGSVENLEVRSLDTASTVDS